ncbi:MAG TPA: metallophosphoesterase [Patescibacteria group bacterium]|nr:metallophosphoesterase [Patescibacteria group bacterium]
MKILIFSDIHGDTRALDRLLAQPADLYISAGDLSVFGRHLERCGERLRQASRPVWVLPGNHETELENRDFCGRYGLVDFHRQTRRLGETQWAGLGYSNPTPFDTPGEFSEQEIAEALAPFDGLAPLYLVVHFPPWGTALDEVAPGRHAGSRVLREWVERHQPPYLFCGHIHECAGRTDQVGATKCFNVGKAGYLVEID